MTSVDAGATTSLILVRHGESVVTVERVIGGRRTCSGLSPLGRRQAACLRDRLSGSGELHADVLVTSDYPRAVETAAVIKPSLGPAAHAETVVIPDFGEHDPGPEVDGMTFDGYVERFGMPDWESDPHADVFPGGETVAEFHERVRRALEALVQIHRGARVVISCHGGVIDAAFRSLLGLPRTGSFELQTLNTSLTEFVSTDLARWRLVRYNDAAHLSGLPAATRAAPASHDR